MIRYGEWFRVVVEETYRQGRVVRHDAEEEENVPVPAAVG